MWKPGEAKRRRKMSKMLNTLAKEVGESKKRARTPTSVLPFSSLVQQRWTKGS